QTPLKDAHRHTCGRTIQNTRPVVKEPNVVCGLVVQPLLADLALSEIVAQCVRQACRVDGTAVEAHHFFFRSADEMAPTRIRRVVVKGVNGREHFRLKQPPQTVIRKVLAHVRSRCQQEEMPAAPVKLPARIVTRYACQSLSQAVTICLAHAEVWLPV